jgi:ribosomal protein S18 acetylase RimI-like enzyme
MTWTAERKLRAAIDAPLGPSAGPLDMRVIARDGWFQRITPSAAGTWHNEVIISSVDGDEERVIDEVVAMYRVIGKPTKWCTGPWTRPTDFDARLARRGFTSWETRGMGIATNVTITPGTASVRRVSSDADLDAYVATSAAAWSTVDDVQREAFRAALGRELVAFVADDLGAGAILLREDYGYLVGTAVRETARGRGFYRSLVATRLAFLQERGLEYAVTQARETTSAPILEHLGFETLFRGRCHVLD